MDDEIKPCAPTTNLLKIYETFYEQNEKENLFAAAYSFCCHSLNMSSFNALNFVAVDTFHMKSLELVWVYVWVLCKNYCSGRSPVSKLLLFSSQTSTCGTHMCTQNGTFTERQFQFQFSFYTFEYSTPFKCVGSA